jgi:hypothetical protein
MARLGGFIDYPDKTVSAIFARASGRKTKVATVKSGQVLKARSFVESDAAGKLIAHSGFTEVAQVTFSTITTGQTLILGGLTFTAGSGSVTAAELVTIWTAIDVGDGYAAANVKLLAAGINATTKGTFTAGTFTGWETEPVPGSTNKVTFRGTTPGSNPTDLADTGTATDPTIVTIAGETSFSKIAGVLVYDVDATSADVDASVYVEASFWADALVWAVDVAQDYVLGSDGVTHVACTAYDTGCAGTSASSNLLKQKFVEGSEFEPIEFSRAGEVY